MQNSLVQIRDLHFSRGTRSIFDGINLDIQRGKITAIMGPSGTGKTTLLKLIGGQIIPDKGQIIVDGEKRTHFINVCLISIAQTHEFIISKWRVIDGFNRI